MWTLPVPEAFASNPVVAAIKVADDPTEHPHKYVIITQNRANERSFNVHTITYNGTQWVSGQGRYDMPWSRALDRIGHLAKVLGRPAGQGSGQ